MEFHTWKQFKAVYALVTTFGVLSVVLVLVWTYKYLGGFGWQDKPLLEFNYHPVCAVVGLIVVYGKGLLLYRTFPFKKKSTLKLFHAVSMLVVFGLSVFSLKCVFDSHDKRTVPIPNLYSLHSWIGLGTVIFFTAQLFFGFIAFLYPRVKLSYRKRYLKYHEFFGTIIFGLSVISCHSGIMEKAKASLGKEYSHLPPAAFIANFLGVSITIFAMSVIYLLCFPDFKRRSVPEEDKICLELNQSEI